jgi:hypothetical protein
MCQHIRVFHSSRVSHVLCMDIRIETCTPAPPAPTFANFGPHTTCSQVIRDLFSCSPRPNNPLTVTTATHTPMLGRTTPTCAFRHRHLSLLSFCKHIPNQLPCVLLFYALQVQSLEARSPDAPQGFSRVAWIRGIPPLSTTVSVSLHHAFLITPP